MKNADVKKYAQQTQYLLDMEFENSTYEMAGLGLCAIASTLAFMAFAPQLLYWFSSLLSVKSSMSPDISLFSWIIAVISGGSFVIGGYYLYLNALLERRIARKEDAFLECESEYLSKPMRSSVILPITYQHRPASPHMKFIANGSEF